MRGLRAFLALPEDETQQEKAEHAEAFASDANLHCEGSLDCVSFEDSDNTLVGSHPEHLSDGLVETNDAGDGYAARLLEISHPVATTFPIVAQSVLPGPGQRWGYGARKQEMAARRASRDAERARAPLDRFETVLAYLPTTGRPAVDYDLVVATLEASAANTVRGLLADMRGFGEACRQRGVSALPAQPASVIAFLRARADGQGGKGAKPSTLSRILWAIGTFHRLFELDDPTKDDLVRLEMKALRRRLGVAQTQARPLRFKGAVRDPVKETARGVSLQALLKACGDDEKGARDFALLSIAYDTGLRASELVAIEVEHILPSSDPHTRLLAIPRHKGDQEGEGATAFLSERSVLALQAWLSALAGLASVPEVTTGPIFRRLFVKRRKPQEPRALRRLERRQAAERHLGLDLGSDRDPELFRTGIDSMTVVTAGVQALRPQAVTQIFKARLSDAWEQGLLADLSLDEYVSWYKGISAHSTRVGITNDLFASGEDLAGIMDALRWRSPKMALAYNRNLAAEHGAAGRLLSAMK
ncbi:Phage integrase family protein [Sphingobium sp. AP50]|uniref:tyrosine-type recombinase/integrase n=1 Tax=Sphingobium sp. AP50 TaxID=1884369 RepID=UPI0008B84BC7|nr:tyrosine-type recombinase/integrase [Sphingobium sp. AP50]SEJ96863.1 Phage integrase family protein [Sphingobium sp. AP50]